MADKKKKWLQILAYVTGSVNQGLLLRNEYLVAENRILKSQIKGRLWLADGERATLAEIAKRLGNCEPQRRAMATIGEARTFGLCCAVFRDVSKYGT